MSIEALEHGVPTVTYRLTSGASFPPRLIAWLLDDDSEIVRALKSSLLNCGGGVMRRVIEQSAIAATRKSSLSAKTNAHRDLTQQWTPRCSNTLEQSLLHASPYPSESFNQLCFSVKWSFAPSNAAEIRSERHALTAAPVGPPRYIVTLQQIHVNRSILYPQ